MISISEVYSSRNYDDVLGLGFTGETTMNLLQHELNYIADCISDRLSDRFLGKIRTTIREEMKIMTDQAVVDLAAATTGVLDEMARIVTALQADSQALAAAIAGSAVEVDAAIADQTKRLVDGAAAAA